MRYLIVLLFSSIPFGFLISKFFFKTDIRNVGSKNIGATNIYRSFGKKISALVLILDALKGILAASLGTNHKESMLLCFIAILCHIFSPFLKFKGGKGIAAGIGSYLFLFPINFLFGLLFWILIFKKTHLSSLSSLITFFIIGQSLIFIDIYSWLFGTTCFLVFVYSHLENIKRIINKKELNL